MGHDKSTTSAPETKSRQVSAHELAAWGMEDLVYVKPVSVDGEEAFAIHTADGRQLAVMRSREVALAAARQNDLEPQSVH